MDAFRPPTGSDRILLERRRCSNCSKTTGPAPQIIAELDQAIEDAMKGVRDPDKMRRAAEEMDRTREAIYRRIGHVDFWCADHPSLA